MAGSSIVILKFPVPKRGIATTHPITVTITSAGMAILFSLSRALIPYTAVTSMIIPHTTVDTGIGIFTPVLASIRLENAEPQTPFCTANQPIMEIINNAEISFDDPCFPKTPDATTHVGTPRSLPMIPQNIINATITAYPITPDQMA